jgi:uncharacterized membrane protein YeaQ/YmgE (transglycosylase-associated protein family)
MSMETFLLWVVVGAISGWLASVAVGGGFGLLGDVLIGVIGAFIGGALFRHFGWHAPFAGLAGTIFIAFIGAVILLLILRLIAGARTRRRIL